ncbi:hypothetical protein NEOLEDRAFT_911437 [Neolentinus lepideus HHB14362 ss-1]|uniref:Secreted protein n=1 Tax=Neolentinus lepideus HHB14362 ss-1 TaxID=1314782 RepID=A0A165UJY1_9AGAM|nr:hypothetical protein NEOLEDRAFT_911437 [Neolentinus lepideus HHB14362 ss-1]
MSLVSMSALSVILAGSQGRGQGTILINIAILKWMSTWRHVSGKSISVLAPHTVTNNPTWPTGVLWFIGREVQGSPTFFPTWKRV